MTASVEGSAITRAVSASGIVSAPTVTRELAAWLARGFREAGIVARALETQVAAGTPRVPARILVDAWMEAEATTRDPLFGLRLGCRAPVGAFGILDFAAGACEVRLIETADETRVEVAGSLSKGGLRRHVVECLFTIIVTRVRTAEEISPLRVAFARAAPDDISLACLEAFFRCTLDFDAPQDELVFPRCAALARAELTSRTGSAAQSACRSRSRSRSP